MSIKKAYQPIIDFLVANEDKKVKSILDQVIALASAKTARAEGNVFKKDATGATVAIFDYYFKRWMPLVGERAVEFGAKANTATGYNSMCKEGVSLWTKAQRQAKQAGADLLARVASGEVQPSDIAAEQARIEEERKAVPATELGFATEDELVAYLTEAGVTLAE